MHCAHQQQGHISVDLGLPSVSCVQLAGSEASRLQGGAPLTAAMTTRRPTTLVCGGTYNHALRQAISARPLFSVTAIAPAGRCRVRRSCRSWLDPVTSPKHCRPGQSGPAVAISTSRISTLSPYATPIHGCGKCLLPRVSDHVHLTSFTEH